jgi:TIR domain/PEGA domain
MIAISYRREDSLPITGRLYDRLQAEFGRGKVFMDFDSIPYGVDFRDHIKEMIDQSKVLVAMIGPDWVGKRKHRERRIDDPTDFVRIEIAYALNRDLPIIPVLVNNAQMPGAAQLPKEIEGLAFRNALTLDVGIDFHHHAERLVGAINRILAKPAPTTTVVQQPPMSPAPPAQASLATPETTLKASTEPTVTKVPTPHPKTPPAATPPPPKETYPEIEKPKLATSPPVPPPKVIPETVTKPTPPPQPPDKLPSPVILKPPAKPSWIMRVGNSISRLQDRFMADYVPRDKFAPSSKETWFDRNWKKITSVAFAILSLAIVVMAVFWGYLFHQKPSVSREESAQKNAPKTFSVAPVTKSAAAPVQADSSAVAKSNNSVSPATAGGTLRIESTPQGQAYEVIDSTNKHYAGKTPETLEDLPQGYAQVIFRREGFADHTSYVWLSALTKPSATWNFPDDYRLKPAARVEQSATVAPLAANPSIAPTSPTPVPTVNAAARNGRSWQDWISDFVRQFVVANQSPDANSSLICYAAIVNYFGEKNRDQEYIRKDIERYNLRWPIRHDEIDGDVQLQEKVPGEQCGAHFKLNFYAESPQRNVWTKGQFAIDLEITSVDGIPKITAIQEKMLHQQKGIPGKVPAPTTNAAQKSYPSGIPVPGKRGIVRSPYAPSKGEIDVHAYHKGAQVKDPYTGKIFIAP